MTDPDPTATNHARNYTLLGVGFGLIFPLVALIIDESGRGLSMSLSTFYFIYSTQPLHLIIDTAPILLGFFAYLAGARHDRIARLYLRQSRELRHQSAYQRETSVALDERDRLLQAIQTITDSVTSTLDLNDIVHSLSQQIVEFGILDNVTVALVDHEEQHVRVVATIQRSEEDTLDRETRSNLIGLTYPLDDVSIAAEVARTGVRQIIEGWDDRFDRTVVDPEETLGSVSFFLPIRHAGRTHAVVATGGPLSKKQVIFERIESMDLFFRHVGVALEHGHLVRDLQTSRDQAEASSRFIRGLYEIASNDQWDIESQIVETLKMGCTLLSSEVGIVASVEGSTLRITHIHAPNYESVRSEWELDETYCEAVVRTEDIVAIDRATGSEWACHKSFERHGFESFIGVPIWIEGRLFGTLSFFSKGERDSEFNESEVEFIRLVGQWTSAMVGRLRAERELEHLFGLSIGLLAIAGLEGNFIRVNPAFSRILGFENHELAGMRYVDIVHPDDRRSSVREFARLRKGKTTFYFENRCLVKDGDLPLAGLDGGTRSPGGCRLLCRPRHHTPQRDGSGSRIPGVQAIGAGENHAGDYGDEAAFGPSRRCRCLQRGTKQAGYRTSRPCHPQTAR